MIRVNLTDGYYITITRGVEHTLCRETEIKTGKNAGQKLTQFVGYYTSLHGAVERYLACACDAQNGSNLDSVKEYAELVDKILETVITAITQAIKRGGLIDAEQLEADYEELEKNHADLKRRYNRLLEVRADDDESDDCYED